MVPLCLLDLHRLDLTNDLLRHEFYILTKGWEHDVANLEQNFELILPYASREVRISAKRTYVHIDEISFFLTKGNSILLQIS